MARILGPAGARADRALPGRGGADRGHQLVHDHGRATHPGYPAIGHLKGLAEIRGVMTAVAAMKGLAV